MPKIFPIIVASILLSSCQSVKQISAQLDGSYSWWIPIAAETLTIEGNDFNVKGYLHLDEYSYAGKLKVVGDVVILNHESYDNGSRRFRLVFVGKNQYLLDETLYPKFIEKGLRNYDQIYKKRREKNH